MAIIKSCGLLQLCKTAGAAELTILAGNETWKLAIFLSCGIDVKCANSKDTKTLTVRNTTLLPVMWRLTGLENIGDDFSVSQEGGIIQPKTDFLLNVYFRALKPVTTNRKAVRIEVFSCVLLAFSLQ